MKTARLLLMLTVCSTAALTQAQTVVPHTFQDGTPAEASEGNENFDALAEAIDEGWGGRLVVKSAGVVLGFAMEKGEFITKQGYIAVLGPSGSSNSDALRFETSDCSGAAYVSGMNYRGAFFTNDLSSYWVTPLAGTLETTVTILSSKASYETCEPVPNILGSSDVQRVIPNDPALTGIPNRGARGGQEFSLPITHEFL